jgi:hypothetical protein
MLEDVLHDIVSKDMLRELDSLIDDEVDHWLGLLGLMFQQALQNAASVSVACRCCGTAAVLTDLADDKVRVTRAGRRYALLEHVVRMRTSQRLPNMAV